MNDVTVRDVQMRTPTWTMGKSFDTHGPLGPWLTTADEVGDPHALELRTFVNGELRQHSNTRELLFDGYALIEHLTSAFTLEPGDVIGTGTPGGVGMASNPPRWLCAGDVVRIEIRTTGRAREPRGAGTRVHGRLLNCTLGRFFSSNPRSDPARTLRRSPGGFGRLTGGLMLGRTVFFGLMLAIGVVACADGNLLKHLRGGGHSHHHDDYGGGYAGSGYGDGGDSCGFDDEGVYHPCPCVTNIEDYEPCGFDDEGVYHECPIARPTRAAMTSTRTPRPRLERSCSARRRAAAHGGVRARCSEPG